MRHTAPMKTAKIGCMVVSALLCLAGLTFICYPSFSVRFIGTLCGIICIAFGAFKLVGYFSRDLYRLAFQYDLAFGLLLIALGIVLLTRPSGLLWLVCIVLGISVLTDGLFKIQIAVDAKSFGLSTWWFILAIAVLAVVAGLLVVLRPTESSRLLTVLLGLNLLIEGILNLSTMLTAVKIIRHQQPDVVEVHIHEEGEK